MSVNETKATLQRVALGAVIFLAGCNIYGKVDHADPVTLSRRLQAVCAAIPPGYHLNGIEDNFSYSYGTFDCAPNGMGELLFFAITPDEEKP